MNPIYFKTNLFHQLLQTVSILPDATLHPVDYLCIQFAIAGQANVIFQHYLQLGLRKTITHGSVSAEPLIFSLILNFKIKLSQMFSCIPCIYCNLWRNQSPKNKDSKQTGRRKTITLLKIIPFQCTVFFVTITRLKYWQRFHAWN